MSCCETTTHTSMQLSVATSRKTKALSRSESGTGREVESEDVVLVTRLSEITSVVGRLSAPNANAAKSAALERSSETMAIARSGSAGCRAASTSETRVAPGGTSTTPHCKASLSGGGGGSLAAGGSSHIVHAKRRPRCGGQRAAGIKTPRVTTARRSSASSATFIVW